MIWCYLNVNSYLMILSVCKFYLKSVYTSLLSVYFSVTLILILQIVSVLQFLDKAQMKWLQNEGMVIVDMQDKFPKPLRKNESIIT